MRNLLPTSLTLVAFAICSASAVTLLKAAMAGFSLNQPKSLALLFGGGCLYVLSFGLWLLVLRVWPLAVAYAAATTVTLVLVTAIGWLFLGESPNAWSVLGSVLVVSGVIVLGLSTTVAA